MFDKEISGGGGNRREVCCNKEAVTRGVFYEFFTVFIYVGEKKTLIFGVTPALCHFDGAVDVSLRVQYLHLLC